MIAEESRIPQVNAFTAEAWRYGEKPIVGLLSVSAVNSSFQPASYFT
jgi:hypothetical protein